MGKPIDVGEYGLGALRPSDVDETQVASADEECE
jgi:hypothetical protein